MATWRLAESLKKLREKINAEFPTRSKVSDGAIGDAAHASRSSDHNPWIRDGNVGVVSAIDITHDPKSGCTGEKLATALVESRDPRIKYIIWNRRMIASYPRKGKPAWTWLPYTGANAHAHHLHISVSDQKALYDSRDDWDLTFDMATSLDRAATDDMQPGESSAIASPVVPPGEVAKVEVTDGNVKVETNQPVLPPEKIAIEKPVPLGFAAGMQKKISGVLGGEITLQIVRDYAEQAKSLGLSPRFWLWVSLLAVVGGVVWLAVEVYRHWSGNKRELEITNQLIAANTTPANTVTLVDPADLLSFEKAGYKVIRR